MDIRAKLLIMPLPPQINAIINQNINNPSKEILASSGIYDKVVYAPLLYATDRAGQLIPNAGIVTTTPSPAAIQKNPAIPFAYSPHLEHSFRVTAPGREPGLERAMLSDSNYFVDDMLVFNKYIHYDVNGPLKTFDPQSFLQEAIVQFNIYGLEYR